MSKNKFLRVLKIAIGSTLAIIIANLLHLKYSTSAGIITLLTIQDTKRETLSVAGKRVLAYFISIVTAYIVFHIWGYHITVFAIYLFIFVFVCFLFGLQDALSICAVITTHFLMEKNMGPMLIENETMLLIVGMGSGVILNLYMLDRKHEILADQVAVEDDMRALICTIADNLIERGREAEEKYCFKTLEKRVDSAIAKAYENVNNNLISDTKYYLEYMEMRKRQCIILKRLYEQVDSLKHSYRQHEIIAEYLREMSKHFHKCNNAVALVVELEAIKEEFANDDLPTTREEFESRAILYYIMYELQSFLEIKKAFVESLSQSEIDNYWRR